MQLAWLEDSLHGEGPTLADLGAVGVLYERLPDDDYQGALDRLKAARGYVAIDCLRPKVWDDPRVVWWYAQNTILYATRAFLATHRKLADELAGAGPGPLPLVHPHKYVRVADPTRGSFSRHLRELPQLAMSSLRKRWRKRG